MKFLEKFVRNIIKKINEEKKEWEATGYFHKKDYGCGTGYLEGCRKIDESNSEVRIDYYERYRHLYPIWIKREDYFPYLTNKELSIEFYNIKKEKEKRKEIEDSIVKDIDKILKKRKKK